MKYLIALIFALIITIVIITYYYFKKEPQTKDNTARMDRLEYKVDSVNKADKKTDTLIIVKVEKIKTIEKHFYHEKINILNLSNDSQFLLLRHNIARFGYLLDTTRR
jgi:hypothetical protein